MDCAELAASLLNLHCNHNKIQDYVACWRSGISCLHSANFPFSIHVYINDFVRSLPHMLAFATLRAMLPSRLDSMRDDHGIGPFITVMNDAMDLEIAFCNNTGSHTSCPPPPRVQPSTSSQPLVPPSISKAVGGSSSMVTPADTAHVNRSTLYCNNCKWPGHIDLTCFKEGGGLAGRHDEYSSDKSHMHAMFAECLEDTFSVSNPIHDTTTILHSSVSPPPTIDDHIIVPITAMCIPSSATNPDLQDLYFLCDHKFPSFTFSGSVDFESTALLSLTALFNALLDSGCTHHIVKDRSLFSNYVSKPISVGTANCGSLQALGTGDISFRSPYGDRHVVFTLRGCLHALDAPIHLLSVGALVECGMLALFTPGGLTTISFPSDHPTLPTFSFSASVHNRLSFLNLEFVSPTISPAALPALSFPRLKLDLTLWHCRFGHIGMDATKAALTKDYVKGVVFEGSFLHDHCIACIVGKSPQHPYSHNGHHATKIRELLHMDLCGPYLVKAPGGKLYFYNILDDCSNFGFTVGLQKKSDSFSFYLTTESFIERSNGILVTSIHVDGALEFTAGLINTSVIVCRLRPYLLISHLMNLSLARSLTFLISVYGGANVSSPFLMNSD